MSAICHCFLYLPFVLTICIHYLYPLFVSAICICYLYSLFVNRVTARQAMTCHTQRELGQDWLRECGLLKRHNRRRTRSRSRSFSSTSTPTSSIDCTGPIRYKCSGKMSEKDVKKATSCLSRTHVSTGGSGGDSVKVSPVRWDDIGGLDA